MAVVFCAYERIGDGDRAAHRYRCAACKHERQSNHPPERLHRPCPQIDMPEASQAAARLNLSTEDAQRCRRALVLWLREGFPERETEEAAWILAVLCSPCRRIRGDRCACCLARGMPPLSAAVRMATVACPAYKW